METLTIFFDKEIKEKLMDFLSGFSEKELKISKVENLKNIVQEDYAAYKTGNVEMLDLDEVENEMKDFISENEN